MKTILHLIPLLITMVIWVSSHYRYIEINGFHRNYTISMRMEPGFFGFHGERGSWIHEPHFEFLNQDYDSGTDPFLIPTPTFSQTLKGEGPRVHIKSASTGATFPIWLLMLATPIRFIFSKFASKRE